VNLEQALEQFDAIETNLSRLEKVWEEMQQLIPDSVAFYGTSPEAMRFLELQKAYESILNAIPPVGDYRLGTVPSDLDSIAQARLDALDLGEFEAKRWVEDQIEEPTREIHEYRSRFREARLELVRERLQELIPTINRLVSGLVERVPNDNNSADDPDWPELAAAIQQVVRLAGSQIPQARSWRDMRRHVHWAQGCDVHDIAKHDWPSVRSDIEASLYSELDPVPVAIENLATLIATKPSGPVTTRLEWKRISAEEFERLLFNLISDAQEYENPQWLMQTNASDRGRDLSVERVITDELMGTQRQRVIIQAKHWTSKSVRPADVTETLTQIQLWEPPINHSLIIATSGRFTMDAVALIEKHNHEGRRPHIEMWPESHLELLLARRPHLVSGFNLRS
jgi:hypothetical protein